NVIAASGGLGVNIVDSSNDIVAGNYVGTDITGSVALGNAYTGGQGDPFFRKVPNNRIGGHSGDPDPAAEGKLHTGNGFVGLAFDIATNSFSPGNYDGIGIGSSFPDLMDTGNTVQGNLIGTNAAGSAPLANAEAGIYLFQSQNTLIGSNGDDQGDALERNVISGNTTAGITID